LWNGLIEKSLFALIEKSLFALIDGMLTSKQEKHAPQLN
jgi:hypothetical protein